MKFKNKKVRYAFTLVEFLVVLVIVCVLFVVLLSRFDFSTNKALSTGTQTDLKAYSIAVQSVIRDQAIISSDLNLLSEQINDYLDTELQLYVDGGHLKSSALDPYGNEYLVVVYEQLNNNKEIAFISGGLDSQYFTGDDNVVRIICLSGGKSDVLYPLMQAHQHIFEKIESTETLREEPTCSSYGKYYYSCNKCSMKSLDTFDGSSFNETEHIHTQSTYVDNNESNHIKTTVCKNCGTDLGTIEEEHDFMDGTCSLCGRIGHIHIPMFVGTVDVHTKCSTCNTVLSSNHTVNSTSIETVSTCTIKGINRYFCECGYSYTKQDIELDENNHTGSEVNGGTSEVHTKYSCCGATISDVHAYDQDSGLQYNDATCIAPAQNYKQCECGYNPQSASHVVNIGSPRGHTGGIATCTTKAVCTRCNIAYGSMLDHDFGDASCTQAATCRRSGCEVTTGEPLGHTGGTATCIAKAICTRCDTDYGSVNTSNHTGSSTYGGTSGVHTKYSCCGATISTSHSYTVDSGVQYSAATCTAARKNYKKCVCGYNPQSASHVVDTGSSLGHIGGSATCTAKPICTRCNTAYGNTLEHDFGDASCTQAATCKRSGCSVTTGEPIGHTGGTATCIEKPVCTRCGTSYGNALGHNTSGTISYVAPTCTTSGVVGGTYCTRCNNGKSAAETTIEALGHTGGTATCMAKAICTRCGTTYGSVNSSNHTGSSTYGGTAGVHTKYSCCGATISTSHSYTVDSGVQYSAATCTATRKNYQKCSCGYNPQSASYVVNTGSVNSSNHTGSSTYGGTAGVHTKYSCCGATISTSHSYTVDSGVQYSAATCTAARKNYLKCSCGYNPQSASYVVSTGSVNSSNHTGSSTYGGTADVHTKYSCCGATISTSHSYTVDSGVQYSAATCTAARKNYKKCVCGYNPQSASYVINTGSVNSSNHTGSATKGGTETVHSKYSCCGVTISDTHSYSQSVLTDPTCITKGTSKYTCTCGYSYTEQDIPTVTHRDSDSNTLCDYCNGYIVPQGGTYYKGISTLLTGDYSTAITTYYEGEIVNTLNKGDVLVLNNYEYRYQYRYNIFLQNERWANNYNNAWGVRYLLNNSDPNPLESYVYNKPLDCSFTFANRNLIVTAPTIPANVLKLTNTFDGCSSLKTYVGSTDPDGDFSNYVIPNSVTNMIGAFYRCSSLTMAPIIPDAVTDINSAFYGCTSLTTAPVIPNSVTDMEYAFEGCSSLTTAPVIPDGVIDMENAFRGCSSLTTYHGSTDPDGDFSNYVIPNSVTDMNSAFYNCSLLTIAPVISNGVTDMSYTFNGCTALTTAPVIPNSVTNISSVFYGCSSLTTYVGSSDNNGDFSNYIIPNGVTNMYGTFEGCSSLTTAPVIPDGVIDMDYAFKGCSSLTTAPVIPNSVTNISSVFSGCSSLTTAPVIPDGVIDMEDAFDECSSLITYHGSTDPDGDFSNYVIPNGVTNMYRTFANCRLLTMAPVIPNGVTDIRYVFNGCTALTTVPVIPNSVTDMYFSFNDCSSLKTYYGSTDSDGDFSNYIIPNSVTDLGCTFSRCLLMVKAPVIPNSVTNISSVFSGCSSLTTAPVIPNSVTDISSIFQNCSSLKTYYGSTDPDGDFSNYIIPNSVTNMKQTFANCPLMVNAPTIPASVTNTYWTFYLCPSLTGNITINANPTTYSSMFGHVDFANQHITLIGSSTMLDTLGATGRNYCSECNGVCKNNH